MGFGGISIWQLLIILAIIILIFGTKKFRSIGSDLGSAIKGFRNSVKDDDTKDDDKPDQLTEQKRAESASQPEQTKQTDKEKH